MRKYTDQGKVYTRSGFGAGLVEACYRLLTTLCIFGIGCSFCSCIKQQIEKRIYPDKDYFFWSMEYELNGEKKELSYYVYDDYWRKQEYDFNYYPKYTGLESFPNEEKALNKRQWSIDYSTLSFNLAPPISSDGFYFHIVGPGDGPFKENVVYSSSTDRILYYPELWSYADNWINSYDFDCNDIDISISFNGLDVVILSSSFRFSHSIKERVGTVLDFYFDFEEVLTSVPESPYNSKQILSVGDTLRITNGHFTQAPLGMGFIEKVVFD